MVLSVPHKKTRIGEAQRPQQTRQERLGRRYQEMHLYLKLLGGSRIVNNRKRRHFSW